MYKIQRTMSAWFDKNMVLGLLCTLGAVVQIAQGAAIVSDVEKQLEKFGTRVGKNEFVSMFKDPQTVDSDKPGKTYVLLSKLYMVPPSRTEELSAVLKLPSDQLKFRSIFPIVSTTAAPKTTSTTEAVTVKADHHEDTILFREETTSKKPSVYNTQNFQDKGPSTSQTAFRGWNLSTDAEDHTRRPSDEDTAASLRRLLLYRLSQQAETRSTTSGAIKGNQDDTNRMRNGNEMNSRSQEDLSWYTLISVPSTKSKKSSDCPPGQRRDHRGICRSMFIFGGGGGGTVTDEGGSRS